MSVVAVRSLDMQSAFAGGDNLKPHEIYDETKETNPSKHDISTKPDIVNPGSHDVLLGRGGGKLISQFSYRVVFLLLTCQHLLQVQTTIRGIKTSGTW